VALSQHQADVMLVQKDLQTLDNNNMKDTKAKTIQKPRQSKD
jgi:hypothetical protein